VATAAPIAPPGGGVGTNEGPVSVRGGGAVGVGDGVVVAGVVGVVVVTVLAGVVVAGVVSAGAVVRVLPVVVAGSLWAERDSLEPQPAAAKAPVASSAAPSAVGIRIGLLIRPRISTAAAGALPS
jgi:hypothetical protein